MWYPYLQNICDTYFFGQITFSYKKSTLVLVIHDVIGFGISLGDIGTWRLYSVQVGSQLYVLNNVKMQYHYTSSILEYICMVV